MTPFDARRLFASGVGGHTDRLGIEYRDHGADWVELELPWRPELVGDADRGVLASGPILAMMDVATAAAVWARAGAFVPQATLDLRVDYLRPATPGQTVAARGECYRLTRQIAFVRGYAHDGDPDDPVAHVAGTFMAMDRYR